MDNNVNTGSAPKTFLMFLILIVFTACFSWFCYNLFNSKEPSIISNLEVSLSESKKVVDKDSSNSDMIVPHTFNVTNNGNVNAKYKVMINDSNNGMGNVSLQLVHYQLILNNSVIKSGTLDDISGNVLDTRSINANTTYEYNLKVWLDDEIYDDDVKFTYSLKIMPVVED